MLGHHLVGQPGLQLFDTLQHCLCGTVLTVSNDGKLAVVSDPAAPPIPGQVYIYNGSSASTAPVDLVFDNPAFPGEYATAAAFSPIS